MELSCNIPCCFLCFCALHNNFSRSKRSVFDSGIREFWWISFPLFCCSVFFHAQAAFKSQRQQEAKCVKFIEKKLSADFSPILFVSTLLLFTLALRQNTKEGNNNKWGANKKLIWHNNRHSSTVRYTHKFRFMNRIRGRKTSFENRYVEMRELKMKRSKKCGYSSFVAREIPHTVVNISTRRDFVSAPRDKIGEKRRTATKLCRRRRPTQSANISKNRNRGKQSEGKGKKLFSNSMSSRNSRSRIAAHAEKANFEEFQFFGGKFSVTHFSSRKLLMLWVKGKERERKKEREIRWGMLMNDVR